MSSVQSVVASPSRGARFFVSTSATSNTYTATGAAGATVAAGVVVRDMGKTIRTPGISALNSSVVTQVILRKVARAAPSVGATALLAGGLTPAAGFVGFVESNEDASNSYYTFYINLYDGEWVAVNL